jgi:hypothetical protein
MKTRLSQIIFYAQLVFVFIMVVVALASRALFSPATLALWAVAFALSVWLIILTARERLSGLRKIFLLLSGASVAGAPVFVILHNLVSGLLGVEEPVFFVLAVIVCPLAFLVGAVGGIVLAVKHRQLVPGT